jgi:hypothetical protein
MDLRWQRSHVCGEEVDDDFFAMAHWNDIQERLKKVPYKMKLHIKEMMRQLAFPEDNVVSTSKKGGNQGSKENGEVYTKRVIYESNLIYVGAC